MLHRMMTQAGSSESDHGAVSDAVRGYHRTVGVPEPETLPCPYWGGVLAAWAAVEDGLSPPPSPANPISWLAWGDPLAHPKPGAVAVMTEGSGRQAMQVGVVARVQARRAYVVCAHDGAVQVVGVPIERVIAVRRPPVAAGAPEVETYAVDGMVIDRAPDASGIDVAALFAAVNARLAAHEQSIRHLQEHAIGGVKVISGGSEA